MRCVGSCCGSQERLSVGASDSDRDRPGDGESTEGTQPGRQAGELSLSAGTAIGVQEREPGSGATSLDVTSMRRESSISGAV